MDEEDDTLSLIVSSSSDADDPIVMINETYIKSNHLKLKASGLVFFAQRLLLKSPPNYEKAIKLWQKALIYSNSTNTIALYNLGVHYYLGKGIEQDFKMACDLFEKAGLVNNHLYGCRNFGVKESSFALGKCYEEGTGRSRNLKHAGDWYYESYRCDCGYGPAGIKYINVSRENGSENLSVSKRFLDATAKWGIVPDSFSVDFLLNFENPQPSTVHQLFNNRSAKYWVHEKEIRLKAETVKDGFSAILRNAMNEFAQGLSAMSSYFDAMPEYAHREQVGIVQQEIIHHVASAFRYSQEDVAFCRDDIWTKFQQFINSNLNHPLADMKNTSNLDRDARICKLVEMEQSIVNSPNQNAKGIYLKFLKQSKSKYSTEFYFHRMSICFSSINELLFAHDAGLDLEVTTQTFPSNPDILYWRGNLIGNRHVEQLTKEKSYLDFIKVSPPDHKNLPDTFYRLAKLNAECRNFKQCRTYYERGVDAEKNLLSFYLPYESQAKQFVKKMLNIV